MELALYGRHNKGAIREIPYVIEDVAHFLTDFETVKLPKNIARAMRIYLDKTASDLKARHSQPYTFDAGNGSNRGLMRRSGKAMQSIQDSVMVKLLGSNSEVLGRIGGIAYLYPQEYGAIIKAKRSKYLTVPLPAALTSNGIPKKRSARQWSNTFVKKSKKGNLIIFQKSGKRIIPLYVLKKQVKIPARLGMRKQLDKNIMGFFTDIEQQAKKEWLL